MEQRRVDAATVGCFLQAVTTVPITTPTVMAVEVLEVPSRTRPWNLEIVPAIVDSRVTTTPGLTPSET